jgi:hypothetical protein
MARRKNMQVDEVYHSDSGLRVPIYLTPENEFYAEAMTQHFVDKDARNIKSAVWSYINKNFKLEFLPVIHIKETHPFTSRDDSYIGLECDRFYYAVNSANNVISVSWDEYEESKGNPSRLSQAARSQYIRGLNDKSKFVPPVHYGTSEPEYYLPYTEETWTGVQLLIETIKKAKLHLQKLLEAPDGGAARFQEAANSLIMLGGGNGQSG